MLNGSSEEKISLKNYDFFVVEIDSTFFCQKVISKYTEK